MKKTVKSLVCIVLVFSMLLSLSVVASASAYEIPSKTFLYVATNGSDSNDGSFNAPFATIEKARDTLREMKKNGTIAEEGAVVYVRGGKYSIFKGISFNALDSGTKEAPITYRAYPGEKVEFIGGIDVELDALKPVKEKEILDRIIDEKAKSKIVYIDLRAAGMTEIPEPDLIGSFTYEYGMKEVYGHGRPSYAAAELVVNGKGQQLSRYPNDGYLTIDGIIKQGATPYLWSDEFIDQPDYVKAEDRVADPFEIVIEDERITMWENAKDPIIYGTFYWSWADQSVFVDSIDKETKVVKSAAPSCYGVKEDQSVYFYNLLEEIDVPGEYYIDRETGRLYYYPVENIESVQLTTLKDTMFAFSGCQYLNFKDFYLAYMRNGGMYLVDCKNMVLDGLDIYYTAKGACIGTNCSDMIIKNCYFHDVNGGLEFSGGDRTTLTPGNIYVVNNHFYACDRVQKTYKSALTLNGCGNYAYFNELHEAQHLITQISGNNMEFAYNEVYDACKRADDMGAFYTGQNLTTRGNRIYFNYFHDIKSEDVAGHAGVHAVYFDGSQSWYYVQGNVFENNADGSIYTSGSYNTIAENIFVNCEGNAARLFNPTVTGAEAGDVNHKKNINAMPYLSDLWVNAYPEIVDVIDEKGVLNRGKYMTAVDNIMVNTQNFYVGDEVAKTSTIERNKVYSSDPGFYDMENKNFLLREDSKVYKDIPGFNKIPFTRIGRYSDRAMNRVKNSVVFAQNSPLTIVNGERKMDTKFILKDGVYYMGLRALADIIGAQVEFNEETKEISITSDSTTITFKDGETAKVNLNGVEMELENAILNIDDSNYLSINDFAKFTGRAVLKFNDICVFAEMPELLDAEGDKELITYYRDILTVF